MGFFDTKIDAESIKEETTGSGSKYIYKSGMHELTVLKAVVQVNKSGARSVSLFVDYEGQPQVIYDAFRLDKNNGDPHFQAKLFKKFCLICGVEDIAEPEKEKIPIGAKDSKGNKTLKEMACMPEFEGSEVILRLQIEHSKWNGKINSKPLVKNVFNTDKATATELYNETEQGVQYELEKSYTTDNYSDVTHEEVQEWKDSFKKGKSTSSDDADDLPAPKFAKKFGK